MSTQKDDLVVEFLIGLIPERLLATYRTVAELQYPIADQHSMAGQLDELEKRASGTSRHQSSVALVRSSFQPVDFPIETPRSGLEKLHARLSVPLGPIEIPDRDFVDKPSICDIYERTFGRLCGQEACEAYQDALHGGLTEIQAVVAGHLAGNRCQERIAEELLDFIRRRREPRFWPFI